MRAISAFGLVVLMSVAVRPASAEDDNAKKIVGTWEITKSDHLPAGSTAEFTKDGKLTVVVKADKEKKVEGTYKVEKDKLTYKLIANGKEVEETDDIVKLTDDAMELRDTDKKLTTFKKKK
ncbi:MAG: lipocalin family protein [Planctomycetes bacterium]|nr:lipocalin family protein [Planctomycetota bacterium]